MVRRGLGRTGPASMRSAPQSRASLRLKARRPDRSSRRLCPFAITWSAGWARRESSRSEEHTSELQSQSNLVCRLLLEKKKNNIQQVFQQSIKTSPFIRRSLSLSYPALSTSPDYSYPSHSPLLTAHMQ